MKIRTILSMMLVCLAALVQPQNLLAQRNPSPRTVTAPAKTVTRSTATRNVAGAFHYARRPHPFNGNLTQVPASVTRRRFTLKAPAKNGTGRAIGDANVSRQTNLLTYAYIAPGTTVGGTTNNTTNPLTGTDILSPAPNFNPNWSVDEKYIYFTSTRTSNVNTASNGTVTTPAVFNLYRMLPDGSGVTPEAIGAGTNEIEPNIAPDGDRLCYVANGAITVNTDQTFTTLGMKLYYIVISSGTVTALTENNTSGFHFLDVRHPSWAPKGNQVAFAGTTSADAGRYHIYKVDTDTAIITQLTSGPSNDTAPAWSPDGNVIAITTNGTSFVSTGTSSPLLAAGTKSTTDIFAINQNLATPDSVRVTNSAVNGVATNNRNAAWSTLRTENNLFNANGFPIIPTTTDTNGNGTNSQQLLAFASDRVLNPLTKTWILSANGSTNIYFVKATVAVDPNFSITGVYAVTTPEATGNSALPLTTSGNDLVTGGAGHNADPTNPTEFAASFDPNNMTWEDYPTWPQYISSYRITFQSNSNGQGATNGSGAIDNIWASTILDIYAPTLLKYDVQNNQVVGVFRNSSVPPPGSDSSSYVRQFSAGDTVRFRVKVADYESGVAAVFLQIKCPDSGPQSSDGREHKIYWDGGLNRTPFVPAPPYGALDGTNSSGDITKGGANGWPMEWESQAIDTNPNSPTFNTFPQTPGQTFINAIAANNISGAIWGPIPSYFPGWNDYIASEDDDAAFTGGSILSVLAPNGLPYTGNWLQLHDNGPNATAANQSSVEPAGEVMGDGIWSGTWTTPANFPSDWYVDVIVFDKAIDPFDTTQTSNWKIYDNVWGLSTRPFDVDPRTSILYVNDYDCGQKFFQTVTGTSIPGGPTTDYYGIPTESWMTEVDPALLPKVYYPYALPLAVPPAGGPLLLQLNNLGENSYRETLYPPNGVSTNGSVTFPPSIYLPLIMVGAADYDGSSIPPFQRYAQWRILSRGPVPDSVLNAFAPHPETQPADPLVSGSTPRTVLVAERCVIWHSPYVGDLLVGPGTVLDVTVQNQIQGFIQKGGRVFLSGQDLAFGVSGQTPGASGFLHNNFHVDFAADQTGSVTGITLPGATDGTRPISTQTWSTLTLGNLTHFYPPGFDPPSNGIMLNNYTIGEVNQAGSIMGACPNPLGLNTLTLVGTEGTAANGDVLGVDGYYGSVNSPNIIRYASAANGSKVVFSCLPWEAITPSVFGAASPPNPMNSMAMKNRRTELTHNVLDYLRTGRIFGTVRSTQNGGQPVGGATIRAYLSGTPLIPAAGIAISQADGTYVIDALDPTGDYGIDAYVKGFFAQHSRATFFHGAWQAQFDIYVTPATPGTISGTVVSNSTGAPVAGAIVTATDPLSLVTYSATTDINGAFTIQNVPVLFDPTGTAQNLGYVVRISNLGQGALAGFASSNPDTYGILSGELAANFPTMQPRVMVGNGQAVLLTPTGTPSFRLIAQPGTLSGQVTGLNLAGTSSKPVPNATVTAVITGTTTSVTATTDSNGNYTISPPPATYSITVSASGYQTSTAVILDIPSGVTTTKNFQLMQVAPGMLSGSITGSDTTQYIVGATVTLLNSATGNPLTDVDGNAIASVLSTAVMTGTGTYTYNYKFSSVPAGPVEVQVAKAGYKSGDTNPKTVTVTSGQETLNVSFILLPKVTLDPGLVLVSTPQNYTTPIFSLLNFPVTGDAAKAKFYTWNPSRLAYDHNFGSAPGSGTTIGNTDTFHRGVGYFLYSPNGASLTQDGTGDDTTAFNISLQRGWNLIGAPFSFPISFASPNADGVTGGCTIIDTDGSSVPVLQAQSESNPAIGGALFTYLGTGYTLSQTLDAYHGYWLYAYRAVVLVCNPAAKVTRAINRTTGNNTDGWTLELTAQAGDQYKAPAYLGVSRAATNAFDRFKVTAPPAIGDQSVALTFDHSEWGDKSGSYIMDVRSSGLTQQTWNFTVSSTVVNTPVTLHWPAIATITGKQSMTLTDVDSSRTINLRNQTSYTIPASSGTITRHFTLQMTRAGKLKLQLSDVIARHTSGGRAAGVVISYQISTDADVQINILKNGLHVRTLASSVHRAAGVSDTPWDMRDDKGVTVAGDAYTIEVRATDTDGNVVRRVTPLLVTR